MTAKEAIEILDILSAEYYPNAPEKEALDMAIKKLEKDIEKEPVQTHVRYGMGYEYHDYFCPVCDELLAPEPKGNRWKQEGGWSRCENCFQKIKWEDDE